MRQPAELISTPVMHSCLYLLSFCKTNTVPVLYLTSTPETFKAALQYEWRKMLLCSTDNRLSNSDHKIVCRLSLPKFSSYGVSIFHTFICSLAFFLLHSTFRATPICMVHNRLNSRQLAGTVCFSCLSRQFESLCKQSSRAATRVTRKMRALRTIDPPPPLAEPRPRYSRKNGETE